MSPVIFQSQMFWGIVSRVLKVDMPGVGFKPFLLQGKLGVLCSLPIAGHGTGNRAYGKVVSQPLLPASKQDFSRSPDAQELLGQFFSEDFVPYVAADWVCPWEEDMSPGASCVAILNVILSPALLFLYFCDIRSDSSTCSFSLGWLDPLGWAAIFFCSFFGTWILLLRKRKGQ